MITASIRTVDLFVKGTIYVVLKSDLKDTRVPRSYTVGITGPKNFCDTYFTLSRMNLAVYDYYDFTQWLMWSVYFCLQSILKASSKQLSATSNVNRQSTDDDLTYEYLPVDSIRNSRSVQTLSKLCPTDIADATLSDHTMYVMRPYQFLVIYLMDYSEKSIFK